MDVKRNRRRLFLLTICFFCLYALLAIYFYVNLKDSTYIGIRAQKNNTQWEVKKILLDGVANDYDIQEHDIILSINDKEVNENKLLNHWLIVENAQSITLKRGEKQLLIHFKEDHNVIHKFLIFSIIGMIGFVFLFHFIKKQNGGRSGSYYYSFLIYTLFSLLAVIPSSLGDPAGRLMIIQFVSIFPFYLESFLQKTNTVKFDYKRSKLCLVSLYLTIFNIVLCSIINFVKLPNFIAEYLAQGIFSVLGFMLVIVLIKNLCLKYANLNVNNSETDISIISFLSFIPLIIFYIFPFKWDAPFSLVIPFVLLPAFGILHSLILAKLISYRYKLKSNAIYLIITTIISIIIFLLLKLNTYVPNAILFIYAFLLMYALMPYINETLVTMKKQTVHGNSLSLFSAVENEREKISTYIHDSIIQDVIYSLKTIDSGGHMVQKNEVIQVLDEVIFHLRELCSDIYPLMIQEIGLRNTLLASFNELQKKHPILITHEIDLNGLKFSPQISNFILRSIRELINNSILHGGATEIDIHIMNCSNACVITVKDDGQFVFVQDKHKKHYGLNIIKEKLVLLGGRINVSFENQTKIEMEIPFDKIGVEK